MSELTVGVLRELFRHLQAWRALYESDGVDVLTSPSGETYSLWDIEVVYGLVAELPPRQREAIELCLIENIRERDAAVQMGVSPTNPVGMYATSGLEKLVRQVNDGDIFEKFRVNGHPSRILAGYIRCRSCEQVWHYSNGDAPHVLSEVRRHCCSDTNVA